MLQPKKNPNHSHHSNMVVKLVSADQNDLLDWLNEHGHNLWYNLSFSTSSFTNDVIKRNGLSSALPYIECVYSFLTKLAEASDLSKLTFRAEGEGCVGAEVIGKDMCPTLMPGSNLVLQPLLDQKLLYWGELYFVVPMRGLPNVRRVYESKGGLEMRCDNPNQHLYPPKLLTWRQVYRIYKVKASITKH
jgi:hypothetical protein